MLRVLVIGSGGSGKSTLAAQLGARLRLPVVHLDALYWRPGWVATPASGWRETVAHLVATERWVMDGNYGGTLDLRIAACDAVVLLDPPRSVCLARVVWRWLRYAGTTRPDMAPGCPEHLTWEFVRWVWDSRVGAVPTFCAAWGSCRRAARFSCFAPVSRSPSFWPRCRPSPPNQSRKRTRGPALLQPRAQRRKRRATCSSRSSFARSASASITSTYGRRSGSPQ